MPKLLQASVFYRNDEPAGFGFTMPPDMWNVLVDAADAMWMQGRKEIGGTADVQAAEYMQQLDILGQHKSTLSDHQRMWIMLNIIALARNGYLPNNDFNGLLLIYEQEPA